MKALVTEDHKEMREFVSNFLGEQGFEVISVEDGRTAFAALRNHQFDLIVTDNQMGENRSFWGVEVINRANMFSHVYKTVLMSTENVEIHNANEFIPKGNGFHTKLESAIKKWFK